MYRILFICTGNAVRSILAEALLRHHAGGRIQAYSAGTNPAGQVHPSVLHLLSRRELGHGGLRSRHWHEFAARGAPMMDLIVTVCPNARAETAPEWPGKPLTTHWDIEDPRASPRDQFDLALLATCQQLEARIGALLALPLERLDPGHLTPQLDAIA